MTEEHNTAAVQYRYIAIPEFILRDEKISDGAKLLFGLIASRSSGKGYCFSTNSHLSGILKKSTRSITRLICELKDRSYITVENAANPEKREMTERRIRPNISNPDDKTFPGLHGSFCHSGHFCHDGTARSVPRRDDKNGECNNIINNNLNNTYLNELQEKYGIRLTESEYADLQERHGEKKFSDAISEYSTWKEKKDAHPHSDYEPLYKWLENSRASKKHTPGRSLQEKDDTKASREELERFDSLTRSRREM